MVLWKWALGVNILAHSVWFTVALFRTEDLFPAWYFALIMLPSLAFVGAFFAPVGRWQMKVAFASLALVVGYFLFLFEGSLADYIASRV
jgi:hypothetical protein